MSLRKSLKSLTRRDPDAPTIGERLAATAERLAATKKRAKAAVKVGRVLLKAPEPAPKPVDRIALVNYATFLAWERQRVCAELYPHLGTKADRFVFGGNAAERFFYPGGRPDERLAAYRDVPPASTRAVPVLDMLKIDWRADCTESGRDHLDHPRLHDTGERPALPYGWPAIDAELTAALADLRSTEAAIEAFARSDDRDLDEMPGYDGLEAARNDALDTLESECARGIVGLQAKAHALLTRNVREDHDRTTDLAQSLARDFLSVPPDAIEPETDPAFAETAAHTRLLAAYAEDRACRPISGIAAPKTVEATASGLVTGRCWDLCRAIMAEPAPTTPEGLALWALASAILCEGDLTDDDSRTVAAVAMTRAVLAFTGTPLPPGFIGFGDEPDHSERDEALYAATGSLPAWAITEAEAVQASAPGSDTALLTLGRQFDAAHAVWRKMAEALPKRGVLDDEDPSELAAFEAIGTLAEAVSKLPATTIAGLAVRARAALHMTWSAAEHADLVEGGDAEEGDYLYVLDLIAACCTAAGVDTLGEPISPAHGPET